MRSTENNWSEWTSGTAGTTDQTDEDNERKRGSDRGRRNKNQYKFRHPEKANSKDVEQASNQDHKPGYESDYESSGRLSSSSLQTTPRHIARARDGKFDPEEHDPRYRVEPGNSFQPGEVFQFLWLERIGAIGGIPTILDKRRLWCDSYGQRYFIDCKRFVVIANDADYCTCIPILTYGGKGCAQKGVKAEDHGKIYDSGTKKKSIRGEPILGFDPVCMKKMEPGEELGGASRVNYSKLVTVEHNVKVSFIGHIKPGDLQLVLDAANTCWDRKRS